MTSTASNLTKFNMQIENLINDLLIILPDNRELKIYKEKFGSRTLNFVPFSGHEIKEISPRSFFMTSAQIYKPRPEPLISLFAL